MKREICRGCGHDRDYHDVICRARRGFCGTCGCKRFAPPQEKAGEGEKG